MVDVAQLGVGNDKAITGIDDIERLLAAAGQFLVGLDNGGFVVDHGVIVARVARVPRITGAALSTPIPRGLPLEEEVLEPAGTSGTAIDPTQELPDLFLQLRLVEVIFSDILRVAEQGIKEAEIGAGTGVGLRGRGHHEPKLLATDSSKDVRNFNGVAARKAKFFRQALFYAKYYRARQDGPGIFYPVIVVSECDPQTAGRPYSICDGTVG